MSDIKCTKNPYEVLGLTETASKEEIEKRYMLLIKKHRAEVLSDDEESKAEGERALAEISEAYNSIIAKELEALQAKEQVKPNPLLKKMGVNEKKAKNIIHYYKFHFIFGLLAVILVTYFIYGIVTKVDPDFNIAFIGEFYSNDPEVLKEKIKEKIPAIKEPSIDVITLSEETKGQQEYAMQMKAMAVTAAGDIDVYIVDKANFEKYAKAGAFAELDKVAGTLGISAEKCVSAKPEDKTEEHIYGIDVSSSEVFKNAQIIGTEMIVAVNMRAKNYDNGIEFIKMLLK